MFKALNAELVGAQLEGIAGTFPLTPFVEVATDAEGLKSSSLRDILENWRSDKPKPKILYTTPVCTASMRG
jgi:hypothetical protein